MNKNHLLFVERATTSGLKLLRMKKGSRSCRLLIQISPTLAQLPNRSRQMEFERSGISRNPQSVTNKTFHPPMDRQMNIQNTQPNEIVQTMN